MAFLPMTFPDDWPDFVVTSHKRPSGSHSTGLAIDITPVWPSKDYAPSSKYWFYHFHTFFVLWAAQRQGVTYMSAPVTCPHLHLQNDPGKNLAGVEWVQKVQKVVGGKKVWVCETDSVYAVPKTEIFESIKLDNFIKNQLGKGDGKQFLYSYQNMLQEYVKKFKDVSSAIGYSTTRQVKVTSGLPSLPDAELQTILNDMYGGTTTEKILDNLAQIVDVNNWPDLKEKGADSLMGAIIIGALGWLAWDAYKKNEVQRVSVVNPDRKFDK